MTTQQAADIQAIAAAFNIPIAPQGGTQGGLDRALAHAELGLKVFPCRSRDEGGKTAKSPLTPNGWKDARADTDAIRRWWKRWPDALVGLPTGRENGIAVADLDIKNGKDWRISAVKAGLILPTSHSVTTRSGGEHRFYRYPADVEKVKSGADLFKHLVGDEKTGIDIRADGAYVIAWSDLNEQILSDLTEWPTAVFADATRREEEAKERHRQEEAEKRRREREAQREAPQTTSDRASSNGQTELSDLERARLALQCVPADDRDDWYKIGMALKEEFGEAGRHVWDEWSGKSEKFNAADQVHKWESFNGGKIRLGTLFEIAKQYGWEPPASVAFSLGGATQGGAQTEPPPFDSRFTFTNIGAIKEPILDGAFAIDGLLLQEGTASFMVRAARVNPSARCTPCCISQQVGPITAGRPRNHMSFTSWQKAASSFRTGSWRPKERWKSLTAMRL